MTQASDEWSTPETSPSANELLGRIRSMSREEPDEEQLIAGDAESMEACRAGGTPTTAPVGWRSRERLLPVVQVGFAVAVSISVIVIVTRFASDLEQIGSWGYLGPFVIQLLNSATVLLPAPGHAYVFAVSASLNPLLVGAVGAIGASLGEITSYVAGAGGASMMNRSSWYRRMAALTERRRGWAIFLFAATPLPFDVAGIWAGATRYPLWRFLAIVTCGKLILVTMVALAGHYGLPMIGDLFA